MQGGILLILTVLQLNRRIYPTTTAITVVLVTSLLFLSLVVSGGLLMAEREMPAPVRRLHHVVPYVTALSTAATLYHILRHT